MTKGNIRKFDQGAADQDADQLHKDPKVNKILKDPYIKRRYTRNEVLQPKITKAAELLKDEPNAAGLAKTAVDALLANQGKGRVNVFFSYKIKDKEKAGKIVETLEKLTRGRLNITWAQDFAAGEVLPETIRDAILEAHWFVLLLPDPSEDWDWCLFETGMFRGVMRSTKLNKVFCLRHYLNDQPGQIGEFLSVVARPDDPSDINNTFLSKICSEEDFFPGMGQLCPFVTPDEISSAAAEINSVIFPPERRKERKRRRFEPFARIRLNLPMDQNSIRNLSSKDMEKLLNDAKFDWISDEDLGTNGEARRIFGWIDQPETWGTLVSSAIEGETDRRWVGELCSALKQAAIGMTFTPVQATFQAANAEKKIYRPILYAVERSADNSIAAFLIIFVEDVGGTATHPSHVPIKGYVELISSIRLCYRFRWEIVEPFHRISNDNDIIALKEALNRVMKENKSRGKHELDELHTFFEGAEDRRVDELRGMFLNCVQKLPVLMENRDLEGLRTLLTNFAPHNQEYLKLSTKLFADMNAEPVLSEPTTSSIT